MCKNFSIVYCFALEKPETIVILIPQALNTIYFFPPVEYLGFSFLVLNVLKFQEDVP